MNALFPTIVFYPHRRTDNIEKSILSHTRCVLVSFDLQPNW